jgi:hypothetical protein
MNKTTFLFSVEVSSAVKTGVNIKLGQSQIPMNQISTQNSKAKTTFYQLKYDIPAPKNYPAFISYGYSFDGYQQRTIILNYKPKGEVVINDTSSIKNNTTPFFHTVVFFVKANISSNSKVALISPKPIFWNESKFISQCPMVASSNGLFSCRTYIPCNSFGTISYKFHVVSPVQTAEPGRCHSLLIRSPIGGKFICVYDTFGLPEGIPYIPRPIYPVSSQPFNSILQIEYTSKIQVSTVALSMNMGKPEELIRDVGWHYCKEIPKITSEAKVAIGTSVVKQKGYAWDEKETVTIVPTVSKTDFISIRQINGIPLKKSIGVFVQLISLPSKQGDFCGDFSSLITLIDWAKLCGLGHIHVGIDRINDNRLIDPVLCKVSCNAPPGATLEDVRKMKIDILRSQYAEWEKLRVSDGYYGEFVRMNGAFLAPFCKDPFALYTQYRLYAEMDEASTYAAERGISLIFDVIVDNVEGSLEQQIQLLAPHAQYLKVANAASVLGTVSVNELTGIFGALAKYAIKISNVYGSAAILRPEFVPEETNIAAIDASEIPEDDVEEFCRKLTIYRKMLFDKEKIDRQKGFMNFFKSMASVIPSALMLDAAATAIVSIDDLKEAGIIGCSNRDFNEPTFLSPEVASEFASAENKSDDAKHIQNKLSKKSIGVTVFLSDLLMAASCPIPPCRQIQDVMNHVRFVFQKSAGELLIDSETTGKIRDLITMVDCVAR